MIRSKAIVLHSCVFLLFFTAGLRVADAQTAPPAPSLFVISPSSATAGGSGFVLTAVGYSFVTSSEVRWNGSSRVTRFVSSVQLEADILASDIASAGTAQVTVYTPPPGGGLSQALSFKIPEYQNPVPVVVALGPPGTIAGEQSFTLTVIGIGFVPGSVVQWNGSPRATQYASSIRLTAVITAADIGTPGIASVTVLNPSPGGGTSNGMVFAVISPCIYWIDPIGRIHGAGGGTGNVALSAAAGCQWTAFSNYPWLTVVSGSSGNGGGNVSYSVAPNQFPSARWGSLTIAGRTFSVIQDGAVLPVISSVLPQRVVAGGQDFDLTLLGSNFVSGSIVRWNGQDRTTTFLGPWLLRARIKASDVATAGSADVTVANPVGGTSAAKSVTILSATNPQPSVILLSPLAMLQGSAGFTLTVRGIGFVPASKVRWNGQERTTIYESPTMLTAAIPASDVASAGIAAVTVYNPPPGGGESPWVFGVFPGTVITDVSPVAVPSGKEFNLTVFGQNFFAGTSGASASVDRRQAQDGPTVLWNGQPLSTVVVSSTELQAKVRADLVGTGKATVAVTGGGSGSSNEVPVPIIPTSPAPLLEELNPKSVAPGSAQFALTLEGRNFTDASRVLWNGVERTTTFFDSTKLQAIIPAADIATPGASRVSVANPAPGGESNGQTFSYIQALLYPRLATSKRSGTSGPDDSEFTGIAFTNLGATSSAVTLTGFDKTGSLIAGSGITNPAAIAIDPGQQLPLVDYQIFGSPLPGLKPVGWFKMESPASGVVGFFLMFNESLSILDGTDVSSLTCTSYVVPEIEDAGFTQVHVVNPDVQPAQVLFELYGSNGTLRAPGVTRTLAPSAAVVEKLTDLFPTVTAAGSDYVKAVSDRGTLLFEYLGKPSQYVEGLNGQDADGGATVLYSPQYAVGGGDWWTALSVVNLENRSGNVTFRLIGDTGTVLAGPISRPMPARGKLRITDQGFFVPAGGTLTQGYVEVRSDGVKLAGSVVFGDPGRSRFASALPLVGQLKTEMVFSQLASNEVYFTGLAILNPNPSQVTAHIEVYDEYGNVIALKDEPIGGGQRVSKLLIQYFPGLAGQNRSKGYIRVRTDGAVASFALFGTKDALSAVPAQDVR